MNKKLLSAAFLAATLAACGGIHDGDDGHDGTNGINGLAGTEGTAGQPGEKGDTGAPGADGKDGAPGRDGAPGQDGEDGKDGEVVVLPPPVIEHHDQCDNPRGHHNGVGGHKHGHR